MKRLLIVLFMIACGTAASAESPPLGRWHFASIRYRGVEQPRPNLKLHLYFEFGADGEDRVWWYHENEGDHCERRGKYQISDGRIDELVTWVSPENTRECGADPDMQVGRRTLTNFRLIENYLLEMDFGLGDEMITYIWERPCVP